jgi:shikimate kinase
MKCANLFIVGPMGAGKSTIGRRVAERLGFRFLDCDRVLEERTGADIPLIFDLEGERGFRARESALLDELTQLQAIVLATGGGAVLQTSNRDALRNRGFVVMLRTSVEEQLRRMRFDRSRPLLQTPDRQQRLTELAEARNPIYESVADFSIGTDGKRIHRVANQIAREYERARECELKRMALRHENT